MMKVLAILVAAAAATSAHASVKISSNPTHNMDCTGGICAPTAKDADLNATDLANMLAASDVKVVTGSRAVTIKISGPFSWTSSHRLTLDAYYNVRIHAPVVVAGRGAVTIVTDDGGTGGDLLFSPRGKLDFWDAGSSLIVNKRSFTLIRSIDDISAKPGGSFALARDIDLAKHGTWHHAPVQNFSGRFEGLGHTVAHLSIVDKDRRKPVDLGLFGTMNGATVRDVNLTNVQIVAYGEGSFVGALAGYASAGIVKGSSASGTILSHAKYSFAGGLVGVGGSISNSSFEGTVTADAAPSSASGLGLGDQITESHADATVIASGPAGGLTAGCAVVRLSYAAGSVSGDSAGGLVGDMSCGSGALVDQSYATGSVHGITAAGGLIGHILAGSGQGPAPISNSYATGAAIGGDAGGLVGQSSGMNVSLMNSYSLGVASSDTGGSVGGSIGRDDQAVTRAHLGWDMDTSGISDPSRGAGNIANDPGITGQGDAQLKSALPAGFDPAIWGQSAAINNGYPYLLANPPR